MNHQSRNNNPAMNFITSQVRQWECQPLPIDAARLLRIHRYKNPDNVRPVIRQAAENAVQVAIKLSAPVASYVVVKIEKFENGGVLLPGGIRFSFPAMGERLAGCEHLLAFVMTIGSRLDAHTIELLEDRFEPLDALFLEASGRLMIEAATKDMSAELKREAAKSGWRLSMRMGPGYEYLLKKSGQRIRWDLTEQTELFQLFGEAPLPVKLMSSSAMLPKMSRSGIFGLSRIE